MVTLSRLIIKNSQYERFKERNLGEPPKASFFKMGSEYLELITTTYCVSLKPDNYAGSLVYSVLQAFQSNTKILYIV